MGGSLLRGSLGIQLPWSTCRGWRLSGGHPGAAGGSVTEKAFTIPYEEPLEVRSVV